MKCAGRPLIVAIAGGSASGKTSFAGYLQTALAAHDTAIITEDSYYLPAALRPAGDVTTYNFDRPETKDFALLIEHLTSARRGHGFDCPRYDFASHDRIAETVPVAATGVLIVEGLHNLGFDELRAIADITVFVDAGYDVRRTRRIARDVAERGRTLEDTARQFDAVVEPMHVAHVEPQRAVAQRVIVNVGDKAVLKQAADALAAEIEAALASPRDSAH
ncbi:Uridine kinase [Alphaproteobacteria bacterium SO-S41]|nr:Uridine kinase [Alphaproteobacteria bacterium SO-S41]